MERMTEKNWPNLDPWECCGQDHFCTRGCHDFGGCTGGCIVPKLYAHLAAYEDTGLTPERAKELALAEKDGRLWMLAVLPDIPGAQDEIYVIDDDEIYEDFVVGAIIGRDTTGCRCCLYETYDGHNFYDKDIGKTVFFKLEEAEAALKRGR